MRLRAKVREVTGATKHLEGRLTSRGPVPTKDLGPPSAVEIEYRDGGYYLLYFDDADECITDTWHATLEEAKAQAAFEFGTHDDDWKEIGASGSA